ncbi:MAG: nucleotidyltransferase family protein [Myxococcota bacterium]
MTTREAFLLGVLGGELVGRVAQLLDTEEVAVMPLKGALLQRWVYEDPAERTIQDVDLLVAPGCFDRAEGALRRGGFRHLRDEPGRWQSVWWDPRVPVEVDLHQRLVRTRRHRLTARALFAAGRRDEGLFGAPVVLPDPTDLYAHLVAHASTTFLISGYLHRPRDLPRVAARFGFEPRACALHLERRGVARHARLVLPLVREVTDDPFGEAVLSHLPADPVGSATARLARRAVERTPASSPARRLAGLLLNPTLADAGAAVVESALGRIGVRAGGP